MGDVEHSFEPTARRVRVRFGGVDIAETDRALLMMGGYVPPLYELSNYYFPRVDVRTDLLVASAHRSHCPARGEATHWTVRAGGREAVHDAWSYEGAPAAWEVIRDHIAFSWNAMDAWFEEDEQVFVHPRDPYTRVDTVHSSRHVRVEIEGVTLGETRRPILLFETGLPTRYYIPKVDVHMDLLEPTESVTRCPYKGVARYWSARAGDKIVKDIVWSYPAPIPECPKIENLLSFYNEHVDLYVDGMLQDRPIAPFS
jgi:uncharacterized protein (DUF427 family)